MQKRIIIFSASIFLISAGLWAGGWNNTLMGCRAIALGAAFVGVADDPSAIFYNPAGLIFQEKDFNFSINGFYVRPTHEYVMPTGKKAQSKFDSSLPQVFLSYRMSDKVTIGLGFYIPFSGGGVDWKKEELGIPLKSTLGISTLTPSLAYQVSEKLAVGVSLNFYYAVLNVNTEMEPYGAMSSEESGSVFSAGFGLMFRPTDKIGIGMSVRGPAEMKLSGETSFPITIPNLGTAKLNLDSETSFRLPWDIEMGFSYKITENFLISTSAQYTMWSVLDKVEKTIKDIPLTGDLEVDEVMDFKNILIMRVGAEYLFPQGVAIRAGIGLDRYAAPESALSITNIDVDKLTFLGGIGYQTGKTQIDFVYAYAFGKEREKELVGLPLTEKYNLSALILGIGVTFSF